MIEVKNRSGEVMFQSERARDFRGAVRELLDRDISLRGADLSHQDLGDLDFEGADLRDTDLTGANLLFCSMSRVDLRGAVGIDAPVVENLDSKILAAISNGAPRLGLHWDYEIGKYKPSLEMDSWHYCDSTHCRAGWAVALAGEAGRDLEAGLSCEVAGALIYAVSCPNHPVPDFFCTNQEALADIQERAAQEKETANGKRKNV